MFEEKSAKPAGCIICGEESVTTSGPQLCFVGIALAVLCAMMLVFTLLSWWLGGNDYKDSIFGDYVIPALFLGIVVGAMIKRSSSRRIMTQCSHNAH